MSYTTFVKKESEVPQFPGFTEVFQRNSLIEFSNLWSTCVPKHSRLNKWELNMTWFCKLKFLKFMASEDFLIS